MLRRRDPIPLDGRVVAITGAARGIGRETAERLFARGAKVAVGDLDADLAADVVGNRPDGVALEVDVTDDESFAQFLGDAEERLGPLDVLVNNAGIMPVGSFLDEAPEVTRRQVDINVHGVITGMKLALPAMIRRGRGHVINLGSAASRVGLAGEAVYSGTKFAVLGVSEGVRKEILGTGVDISVVMPNLASTQLGSGMTPARGQRMLTAEEIADAIIEVMERPRFERSVPKRLNGQLIARHLLQDRARDILDRVFAMDRVGTTVRATERAEYHQAIGIAGRDGDNGAT
jgi:NADP-dependent 3-hydroxy acid dehydrogenase YdfG